VIDLASFTAEL